MFVAVLALQVEVFHLGYHVLGQGYVAAEVPAFEPFFREHIIPAVHGMSNGSGSSLIIVFGEQAPAPRFGSSGTAVFQPGYNPIVIFVHVIQVIIVPIQVHGPEVKLAGGVVSPYGPDGIIIAAHAHGGYIICPDVVGCHVQVAPTAAYFSSPIFVSYGIVVGIAPAVFALVGHLAPDPGDVGLADLYIGFDGIYPAIVDVPVR